MENNNNNILFSFVLYLSNEQYDQTVKSLYAQQTEYPFSVQLIVIKSSTINSFELPEGKPGNFTVTEADGVYDSTAKAYKAAQSYTKGDFLCFAECGAVYGSGVIDRVCSAIECNSGLKLVSVVCDPKSELQNSKEINHAFSGRSGTTDINEKYNIPFIFLANLFISTSLELNIDSRLECRELLECDMMFRLFEQAQVFCILRRKDTYFVPYSGSRDAFRFYEDLRYSEDELEAFFEVFVRGNIEGCKSRLGYLPRFVQYNIMLFLSWTVSAPGAEDIFAKAMSLDEFKTFFSGVLAEIDDSVINNCGFMLAQRAEIFSLKYNARSRFVTSGLTKKMYYQNTKLCELSVNPTTIEFVTLTHDKAVINGRIKYLGCDKKDFSVFALINKEKKIYAKDLEHNYDTQIWKENVYPGMSFSIEIDLSEYDSCRIEIFSEDRDSEIKRKGLRFGKFSPLSSNVQNCYYYSDGRIMTYERSTSSIVIENCSGFRKFKKELCYLRTLRRLKNDYATHAYLARILYHFSKPFHKKKIWLISDRTNRGDDNGEAFFKYMQTVKNNKIKCYFVIDKNTEEGKRLSKIGKTISTNSKKHKMYHLMSSYVISSQGNNPVVNPLLGGNIYYRDLLCNMRFVFLQHGVTKDDIAGWLNLYNRNIFGFIVSTNPEYRSIFDYDYFYQPENVWLTGMPRNDLLYHDEKKYITIMPTWRKSLMTHPDPVTGIWLIRDDFKESKYYQFYNSLLNSERLIEAAKKYGYTICHKPHPNIEPYIDLFDKNENVKYFSTEKTYREIFAESDLMLTDYSSVAFDFAYLGKPIVYAQFDKQAFFSGEHSYTAGYFDYERDGFGDVTYDLDSTVDCLIDYMKNQCRAKDKYLERIHSTFAFLDKDCCKRVYEKLIEHESFK